ncbi:MAG TPA: peptidoglycan DD-metalloendopeptidase family protein [Rhodothermales bacterium]|nr:peptidoglycan DD-metalloendopeptidase family protein [Rhodothermales bacterium]
MLLLFALLLTAPPHAARGQDGGGPIPMPTDALSDEERAAIQAQLAGVVAALGLPAAQSGVLGPRQVSFRFPLEVDPAYSDFGFHFTSNFVDQQLGAGVQDYACGARTYDGHTGIDFTLFPFRVLMMEAGAVRAVAAADGVIIGKNDGLPDHNCGPSPGGIGNVVYLKHADGSTTWYGHLRKGSLTSKPVGASVSAGEVLGIVGSSGNSGGPHLHFQVHDAEGALIDPFAGACNQRNTASWWQQQPAYRESAIAALRTGSSPSVVNTCPNPEITNERQTFAPGEKGVFTAYFRDQQSGQSVQYRLLRPDGTVFQAWSQTMTSTLSASHWYWEWVLPSGPTGLWTFEAVYEGRTYARTFTVGTGTGMETPVRGFRIGVPYPNPMGASATLSLELPLPGPVRVEAFDMLGRRITRLYEGVLEAGPAQIVLGTAALSPGLYRLRVTTPAGVAHLNSVRAQH